MGNVAAAVNTVVLLGIGGVVLRAGRDPRTAQRRLWAVGLPAVAIGGMLLAGYLFYIELTHHDPYCGPIGDCLRVQQSPYAWLFGWLPVGGLGLAGYGLILIGWLAYRRSTGRRRAAIGIMLAGMLGFGALFSAYLTFIELFVIGAMCAWCLTSALLMLLLLWITWPAGWESTAPLS